MHGRILVVPQEIKEERRQETAAASTVCRMLGPRTGQELDTELPKKAAQRNEIVSEKRMAERGRFLSSHSQHTLDRSVCLTDVRA